MSQLQYTQGLKNYYRSHAGFYDLTRWSFLFGRKKTINQLANCIVHPNKILDIGCGTGTNLIQLIRKFPFSIYTGIDLSEDMLLKASQKKVLKDNNVALFYKDYLEFQPKKKYDLIFVSYALTMMSENKSKVINKAIFELNEGGFLAVVDFHSSPYRWFRNWMGYNHVDMNNELLEELSGKVDIEFLQIQKAYLGLWKYFIFIGKKA